MFHFDSDLIRSFSFSSSLKFHNILFEDCAFSLLHCQAERLENIECTHLIWFLYIFVADCIYLNFGFLFVLMTNLCNHKTLPFALLSIHFLLSLLLGQSMPNDKWKTKPIKMKLPSTLRMESLNRAKRRGVSIARRDFISSLPLSCNCKSFIPRETSRGVSMLLNSSLPYFTHKIASNTHMEQNSHTLGPRR